MVLVEPGADNPLRLTADGKAVHASELARGAPVPPVKTSNPLRESDVPPAAMSQMKRGARQAAADANPGSPRKLPPDAQRMRAWALARWQHAAAGANPVGIEEIVALQAERLKTDHLLGDLPLVVLTRGLPDETGPDARAQEEEHRKDHEAIATTSRRGELHIAAKSGHHVQLDEPELVIAASRRVVSAAHQ